MPGIVVEENRRKKGGGGDERGDQNETLQRKETFQGGRGGKAHAAGRILIRRFSLPSDKRVLRRGRQKCEEKKLLRGKGQFSTEGELPYGIAVKRILRGGMGEGGYRRIIL